MQNKKKPQSLTEFLELTGARLRLFDMGRRITEIPRERFLSFERTTHHYPYPMQQQAWFAIAFQDNDQAVEPVVWFLRFPLDEQGKLLQAARDDFMHRLLERVSENLQTAKEGVVLDTVLKDNPYTFKPREDRMAVFHAKASLQFNRPVSEYFTHAREYFSGALGWEQWSFVGYQGIAELVVRQAELEIERILKQAIPNLPERPREALFHCMENEPLTLGLTEIVCQFLEQQLASANPAPLVLAAGVRALACSRSRNLQQEIIQRILNHPASRSPEILAAISGRAWESLLDQKVQTAFLEALSNNSSGQPFFDQCLGDLLYLPGMREPLLEGIRSPDRSPALSQAIGVFFQGLSH